VGGRGASMHDRRVSTVQRCSTRTHVQGRSKGRALEEPTPRALFPGGCKNEKISI
jgi:hypothetical protein